MHEYALTPPRSVPAQSGDTGGSFFAMISRMRYINRWGLMRNSSEENIQEHSHMVAVLAHALAVISREVFGNTDADPDACAAAALFHDSAEIMTGDLPTPVKYYSSEIRDAYRKVEELSCEKLLSMLPENFRAYYRPLLFEDDESVRAFVKAADKLAAHIKCVEELKAANHEFESAARQTRDALDAMKLPELDYFIEHFLPAFSKTLDEL